MNAPGICFDNSSFYTIIVMVAVIFMLIIYSLNEEKNYYQKKYNESITITPSITRNITITNPKNKQQTGPFRQDIYNEPSSTQSTQSTLKINQNTRGEYTNWHQVGILSPKNSTNNETIMGLYGRRLHGDNWEYYTTHHINTNVKIPLDSIKKELYDGDTVNVTGYQDTFVAEIYELDAPKYIPYI